MPNLFAAKYGQKPPTQRLMTGAAPDESLQFTSVDGLHELPDAPFSHAQITTKPHDYEHIKSNAQLYLWAILTEKLLLLNEQAPKAKQLSRGCAKHTNLTGGGDACTAGELWFSSQDEVYISGDSGRYGPSSLDELSDAGQVFVRKNYHTCILGWNEDEDLPNQIYREEAAQWLN